MTNHENISQGDLTNRCSHFLRLVFRSEFRTALNGLRRILRPVLIGQTNLAEQEDRALAAANDFAMVAPRANALLENERQWSFFWLRTDLLRRIAFSIVLSTGICHSQLSKFNRVPVAAFRPHSSPLCSLTNSLKHLTNNV